MSTNDCDRVRMQFMASADGEVERVSRQDQEHVSSCAACQRWLQGFAALNEEMQALPYARPQTDLWPSVSEQIRQDRQSPALDRRVWLIGLLALGWRALQLFADLPAPALVTLLPVAAAVLVVWLVGRELLTIETWAPELQERGL